MSEFLLFASFGRFKETGFAHLPSSAVKKLVCVCVRRRFGMFLVEVSLGMFHGISKCDARLYLAPVISLPQDALVPLLGLFDGVDVGP